MHCICYIVLRIMHQLQIEKHNALQCRMHCKSQDIMLCKFWMCIVHCCFTHCVMKIKTQLFFPTVTQSAQIHILQLFPTVLLCAHVHKFIFRSFPHCVVCTIQLFPLYLLLCAHLQKFLFRRQHAAHGNTDMASLTRSVSD